jgi:SOS-response transcriptional repressor LexA
MLIGRGGVRVTVGERLEELMRLRGVRASELSRRAGVQQQTLYSILQRRSSRVAPDTLRRLAEALDAPVSYFYDEAPPLPLPRKKVPLLGDVAAGEPIFREGDGESVEDMGGSDYALRVAGDSMAPRIQKGDIVFVKKRPDVPDGRIAVVIVDGEAALKRVHHVEGGVQLVSDNPDYPPMLFTRENSDSIRILGLAVAIRREL